MHSIIHNQSRNQNLTTTMVNKHQKKMSKHKAHFRTVKTYYFITNVNKDISLFLYDLFMSFNFSRLFRTKFTIFTLNYFRICLADLNSTPFYKISLFLYVIFFTLLFFTGKLKTERDIFFLKKKMYTLKLNLTWCIIVFISTFWHNNMSLKIITRF